MARPAKAAAVLAAEGKSHRTKAEMQRRRDGEKAALSGLPMREEKAVAADPVAHAEFQRVRKLLKAVGKNDAMYEAVINDYCMTKADIVRYTEMRDAVQRDADGLDGADVAPAERIKLRDSLYKSILGFDRQIHALQKRRFDIEKESGFTVAAALRAIPKKPEQQKNPLLEALQDDGAT